MMGWILAFHIIGIILWMGGLFTLTRLLGFHAKTASETTRRDLVAYEKKSYYFAVLPGLLLTLGTGLANLFGIGLSFYLNPKTGVWGATFHVKLLLVFILIVIDQMVLWRMRKMHHSGEGKRGFFMAMHGIVGLCFIIIVVLMETRIMVP